MWRKRRIALLLVTGLLMCDVQWAGGTGPYELPTVVVTARTWAEPADQLPASVTIWHPATDTWGVTGGLGDLAASSPNVARTADGPWAGDLSIRGMSGDRIVVTLDGARLATATDLAARLALIDWTAVERVEVLKGPVSALYGSGSLGGMVNIVMAPPVFTPEPTLRQQVRFGGLHNPDGWAVHYRARHHTARHFTEAAVSARDADAYRDGAGEQVRNSQYRDQAGSLRLGYRWAPAADSEFRVQYHRGEEIGIPGTGRAPLPAQADVTYAEAHRWLVALHNRVAVDVGAWATSRLDLYYQQIERQVRIDGFPGGPVRELAPVGQHDTLGARWLNTFAWGDHQVGAGFETWRRELTSTRTRTLADNTRLTDRPLPPANEWSYGAFVEDHWQWAPDWQLTAGLRVDGLRVANSATTQWDTATNYDWNGNAHIGLRWHLTDQLALRGVTAAGYRAPSIEERYQFLALGDGQIKLGNPELDAEQSRFAEMGMDWQNAHWSFEVAGFINALRNRVGEERVDEATLRNASIDRARLWGLEAEARYQWSTAWAAYANLGWLRGDDRSRSEPLPDIAPLGGGAGLRYQPDPAWRVRLRYRFALRQDRVPEGVEETPGWGVVDLSLAYLAERGPVAHEIRLDVLNATDATWRDHLTTWRGSPHNEPGRSLQVAWEARF